jgi:hypothetical protein
VHKVKRRRKKNSANEREERRGKGGGKKELPKTRIVLSCFGDISMLQVCLVGWLVGCGEPRTGRLHSVVRGPIRRSV